MKTSSYTLAFIQWLSGSARIESKTNSYHRIQLESSDGRNGKLNNKVWAEVNNMARVAGRTKLERVVVAGRHEK